MYPQYRYLEIVLCVGQKLQTLCSWHASISTAKDALEVKLAPAPYP